jgi:hypothetical protein
VTEISSLSVGESTRARAQLQRSHQPLEAGAVGDLGPLIPSSTKTRGVQLLLIQAFPRAMAITITAGAPMSTACTRAGCPFK